jgi:hypothetical protein
MAEPIDFQLEKLECRPGDVLVVKVDSETHPSPQDLQGFCRKLKVRTGAALVIALMPGHEIETLNEDAMLARGWMRAPAIE